MLDSSFVTADASCSAFTNHGSNLFVTRYLLRRCHVRVTVSLDSSSRRWHGICSCRQAFALWVIRRPWPSTAVTRHRQPQVTGPTVIPIINRDALHVYSSEHKTNSLVFSTSYAQPAFFPHPCAFDSASSPLPIMVQRSQSHSLTQGQLDAISIIERVNSVLSLFGSLFIIVTFCFSKAFHKPINRLVFYATFGNMLTNVGTLMSRSHNSEPDSIGCQFQAFLIQM